MGGPEADSGERTGVSDRELRVSDAEREHVGQLLQRAVGLGMLSLGEFTERMDTALAAKTRGELNAVLIDLPGIRLGGRPAAPGSPFAHTPPGPVFRPGPPLPNPEHGAIIRARMSNVARKGRWHVAPTLRSSSWMSSVTLDFTQAIMSTQVVELYLDDYCSALTLVVPAEATVDMNNIDLVGSSISNKVRTGPPYGPLHLVVQGRLRFGSVTAKHPFATHWRKLMGYAH